MTDLKVESGLVRGEQFKAVKERLLGCTPVEMKLKRRPIQMRYRLGLLRFLSKSRLCRLDWSGCTNIIG